VENSFLTVFRHEIVHAVVDCNNCKIPRWFNEGLATSFSRGFTVNDGRTLLSLKQNQMEKQLKDISFEKKESAPYSYALANGVVSYLRELGNTNIVELLKKSEKENFATAFSSTLGLSFETFLLIFRESFLSRYTVLSLLISEEGMYALIMILAIYAILKKRYNFKKRLKEMEENEKIEEELLQKLLEQQKPDILENFIESK